MRALALLLMLLVILPLRLLAQEDDKSFLEGRLQDLLSGAGRAVKITGFAGALSSNARLDQMTIADADGVWLTMRDAELVWTRSALLRGRLVIDTLSAREIEITRLPKSEPDLSLSDTEVTPFALPELPVSVNIGALRIQSIRLDPDVLGEPVLMQASGNLTLAAGDGAARLDIRRTDRDDLLTFDGGFSNSSRILRLKMAFDEDRGGLVSRLLGIPGAPPLGLKIDGEAPLSDYTAQIALSSDNQPRLAGQVTIRADQSNSDSAAVTAVTADLSGDVRPLFVESLRPFFGDSSSLSAEALLHPGGTTKLNRLKITSGALNVSGSLTLSADGWPERFALAAELGQKGMPVRLPISGPPMTVTHATLSAYYNAATGDRWSADLGIGGFEHEGRRFEAARISGDGMILRAPRTALTGFLSFDLSALDTGDGALNTAIGAAPAGSVRFDWTPDAPLTLSSLTLQSEGMTLRARAALDRLAEGVHITGRADVTAPDIARFSALAGRDLTGATVAAIEGKGVLLTGAFDGVMQASTTGLQIAEPRLDPILKSKTDLSIAASRNETGLKLNVFTLTNADAQINATGQLNSREGQFDLQGRLAEVARIEPRLNGDAEVTTRVAWATGQPLRLDTLMARIGQTTLRASGEMRPEDPALPVSGRVVLEADDLSRFALLLGQPVSGRLSLGAEGQGSLRGDSLDLSYELTGTSLGSGIAPLDAMIAGDLSSSGSLALSPTALDLRYLRLAATRLTVDATGAGPGAPITLTARLADLGVLTPEFSGPAEARGTITLRDPRGRDLTLALNASGPGGIAAQIIGSIRDYGQSLALSVTGQAPLQLGNTFITPHSVQGDARFDLAVQGPPRLDSVTGQISFSGARAALPTLNQALDDLNATVTLGAGRAGVTLSGTTGGQGRFSVEGPITLAPPYDADLTLGLQGLALTDSELYSTTLNGRIGVRGPLTGGARISGVIDLGKTELRVPSGSGVILGTLPELRHVGEPAAVRQTRQRAGLIKTEQAGRGASYPIDLVINARQQIFVRGRGLDAELGGSLRLTGSTSDVRASGVFNLIRGRLDILGKRLVLTEGLIDMRGSLDPYLRFVAQTEADEVIVRILVEGLVSAPAVTFLSEPELPQEEVVARLLFSRGLDNISPFQAAQLVSAVAQLTGRYDGGVVGKLRASLGLSDLDVTTTADGATQFSAGAYISDNIYSEITADSQGKQEINLNLDLSRALTVRGSANNDGETGIGIFFEKDY